MPKGNKVSRETKVINQPTLGEEDYTCLSRWGQYKHKDLQVQKKAEESVSEFYLMRKTPSDNAAFKDGKEPQTKECM